MTDLISIRDAAAQGVRNVRLDKWANPRDHIEIPILDDKGTIGPWFKLWSPANEVIGQKDPQQLLVTMMGDLDDKIWRPYVEPKTEDAALA